MIRSTGSTPNTALHRTPASAPLSPVSFQAFGDDTPVGGPLWEASS